jgi:sugar lactone lactonase YvrE
MQLNDLVVSTDWTRLASGFQFTEGPLWHPDGFLLFSDIPADTIYRMLPDHSCTVWRQPSGHSNGLTSDRRGNVVACEHGNRSVSVEADGVTLPIATHYGSCRLNSPNDVVVRSDGTLYFTDPPYGIQEPERELPHNGVYCVPPGGQIALLVADMDRPNGLALSPDETVLYIDDTTRRQLRAYDVQPDGSLLGGRIWADMASPDAGGPDGLKVDRDGNVYCTGPGGIWVFDPRATCLGVLRGPELPANLAFGGPDLRTLYITARTGIYCLRTLVPGLPVC